MWLLFLLSPQHLIILAIRRLLTTLNKSFPNIKPCHPPSSNVYGSVGSSKFCALCGDLIEAETSQRIKFVNRIVQCILEKPLQYMFEQLTHTQTTHEQPTTTRSQTMRRDTPRQSRTIPPVPVVACRRLAHPFFQPCVSRYNNATARCSIALESEGLDRECFHRVQRNLQYV